jgi:hypothetical protein
VKTFAIIENGVVVNCIVADDLQTAESFSSEGQTCVEFIDVDRGDTYVDGNFVKTPKPPLELSWAMSGN